MQAERDIRIAKDLVAASAIPLVLAILNEGESYGYAILKRIDELSGGAMEWTEGMLYPLLHRLERLGYVAASWDAPPGGRRRRYYSITDAGQRTLSEQRRQWEVVSDALQQAWHSFQLLPPASLNGTAAEA
jgi:DNA-binding PadR family transcriptional regulator